jgi:hypothetical protein
MSACYGEPQLVFKARFAQMGPHNTSAGRLSVLAVSR